MVYCCVFDVWFIVGIGLLQGWSNLTLDGILPASNILLILLMGEMAKSAELKSDELLKVI